MHVQGSTRREIRSDKTQALFAGLALYFEFFNVRAYDNGTMECLFFHAPNDRLEGEIEMMNGRREGLQGGHRSKSSTDLGEVVTDASIGG